MKVTRLIKCIKSFGFCLFLVAHSFAFAEQPPSEAVVPVEHASFHQLVFADDDIAILNNLYPPNGDSGFHTHYRDLFAVIIQSSQSSGQGLAKPLTASPLYPAGASAYSAVGAEPTRTGWSMATKAYFKSLLLNYAARNPWEMQSRRAMPRPNTCRFSTTHGCGLGD